MTLYFAWATAHESYDPALHAREDEAIFDLEIAQKEGGFAHALITLINPKCGLLNTTRYQHCFIAYKNADGLHLLFKGQIIGMPIRIHGELVQMRFTAEPLDRREKLEALCKTLRDPPFWDLLFVAPQSRQDPIEVLEARSSLFYWSRTQASVTLSDIFRGTQTITLKDHFYYDSLAVNVGPPPLEAINVRLVAEWTQHSTGDIDIAPLIAASFPEGIINTLTGSNLQARWWQPSDYITFPSYHIIESHLEAITPQRTGALNLYPFYSPFFWAGPEADAGLNNQPETMEQRRRIRFKRRWYRGCLRLGWRYNQRRREIAHLTLTHHTQKIAAHNRRRRTLTLFLQDIVGENHFWLPHFAYQHHARVIHEGTIYRCRTPHISGLIFDLAAWEPLDHCQHISDQASRATFFLTDRGKQAIAHALEIARSHLAISARMITIKCRAPFDHLFEVTTDHTVTISDPRLPGGHAAGKVIAYRMCMEGHTGRRYIDLTLGVAVGAGDIAQDVHIPPRVDALYTYDDYCNQEAIVSAAFEEAHTPSGILYRLKDGQYPTLGLLHPTSMTASDLVHEVHVNHTATQQIHHLQDNQYPKRHNLQATLQERPTTVTIRLLDLSPRDILQHEVTVAVPFAWSAPRQIELDAGG